MLLVDYGIVRELVGSQDPDAALVFTDGGCVVVSCAETAAPDAGVLIARRRELTADITEGTMREDQLRALTHCLDNRARDLGA